MLRIGVQFQDFLHGRVACGVAFCLVQFHQGFKILGFFLVEFQDFDELGYHAGANLFAPDHIGKVTAALFEAQKVANFSTGKMGLRFGAGYLVFFQEFTKMRKLIDV